MNISPIIIQGNTKFPKTSWAFNTLYGLNVGFPAKLICLNPNANVTMLGGGPSGRCLSHGGKALINGISAFIKQTPEKSLTFSTV